MNRQLFSLALWMFFGFVFINAIDSILSFIVKAFFYFGLWMEFSISFLKYSIPILSIIIYTLTSVLVINYLNQKKINFELSKIGFPKGIYIISLLIAIFLNPLGNKLTGLLTEKIATTANYEASGFLGIFGITQASIAICRWLAIIVLSIYFYRKYEKIKIEAKK